MRTGTRMTLAWMAAVLSVGLALPARGAVSGRVLTQAGVAIEHARVAAGGETAFTDRRGAFELETVEPPAVLEVSHPRFQSLEVEVSAEGAALDLRLRPKQEIYEQIAVSAQRGEEGFAPVSVAVSVIEPASAAAPAGTVAELLAASPAVSENGQGGIFQTYSIRGIARHRVLTLVSGMRIVGERRAGVSASFIDPLLLGTLEVVRGPASTYYGSGALGGVVQLLPRRFDGAAFETGYMSAGDEFRKLAGWGGERWSLGLAHRRAGRSRAADGTLLDSGYEQTSAVVSREGGWGSLLWDFTAIGSVADDIGKVSTDFPERVTVYPRERHLLLRASLRAPDRWRLEAWAHPNELDTRVSEDGAVEKVANRALDIGWNAQREIRVGSLAQGRVGVEYFGRSGVDAVERAPGAEAVRTLDGAREDELGLYGVLERELGPAVLLGGTRLSWQRQANGGEASLDSTAWTGFGGLVVPLGRGFEASANVGSGLRFPSLSERFFSGTTGRGEVVGNRALDPERSLSFDAGLRWFGERLYVAGYLFHNRIEDYIERVEVEPDRLGFVNLTEGTIEGAEIEGSCRLSAAWTLDFSGHLLEGRAADDTPLADVPPGRVRLGARWRQGRWEARGSLEHRAAKHDPGGGEKAIGPADLLEATLRYELGPGLALAVSGRNLLDQSYFNSADRKVPTAVGRSVGLSLRWAPPAVTESADS